MAKKGERLISEMVLTDDQLKAVGCLALESTRLETHIEYAILVYFGSALGGLIVERKMLDAKTDAFKTAFMPRALNDDHRKELEQLYGEIKSDIAKRNTVVHGSWEEKISLADLASMGSAEHDKRDAAVLKKNMKLKASEVMDLAFRFARYQHRLIDWYQQLIDHENALNGTTE